MKHLINLQVEYDKESSNLISILKTIAILCVITAHYVPTESDFLLRVYKLLGTLGVPVFLIISGYNYNTNKGILRFWAKVFKRVIVPWIIWSIITYVVHITSDNLHFSILYFLQWMFGYGTWLYYVPVLLCCYFVFQLSSSASYVVFWMITSAFCIILTSIGVVSFKRVLTNYQNPINWFLFFGIGLLLKKKGIRQFQILNSWVKCVLFITAMSLSILFYINNDISYWSLMGIVIEVLWAIVFLFLPSNICTRIIRQIGDNTYFTFFFHMQFGLNFVKLIEMRIKSLYLHTLSLSLELLTPLLTLLLCLAVSNTIKTIGSKLKLTRLVYYFGIK